MKRRLIIAGALTAFITAGQAWAQDTESEPASDSGAGSEGAGTEDAGATEAADAEAAASVEADTSAGVATDANVEGALPPPAVEGDDPLKPRKNTWEMGLYTGGLFVSRAHNLHDEGQSVKAYQKPALVVGGRLAYFPTRGFGLEGEFYLGHGDLVGLDSPTTFHSYKAHLILQLPSSRFVPFVLAGAGALGATSAVDRGAIAAGERTSRTASMGRDTDTTLYFGVGAKLALSQDISLRADFRENMMQHERHLFEERVAFTEEVLLGLSVTFPRPRPAPAPVPVAAAPTDGDGDHVVDAEDKCPDVKAYSEDGCPADSDGDQIIDSDDECPKEKGVAPSGCPDADADKDGTPVPCDICPDTPGTPPDGCPVKDADGDGIPDKTDKCPSQPETKNGYQDDDGCPDEIPKEVKAFTGVIKGIYFDKGKATIRPASTATLNKAVEVLKKYPSIRIEVSGHTSSEGDAAFNDKLSQDRADAVRSYLVDAGVDASRVTAKGVGSTQPIVEEKNEATREKNRRIEFKILEQ